MKSRLRAHLKPQSTQANKSFFETVACPLCNCRKFEVIRPGRFPAVLSEQFLREVYRSSSDAKLFEQVVRCLNCQLVYLNPRLKASQIIEAYAQGEDSRHVSQDPMRIRTFTVALQQLRRAYKLGRSKAARVLDIGCASGAFLVAARKLGLQGVGIEPNRWLARYGRTRYRLDVRPGVLADYHFPNESFSLATLWDVIEHVPRPAEELKATHRVLKKEGILVVNYPDYQSLPARLLGKKWPFWLSAHLTYYSPETIKRQLERCGFTVLSLKPHWQTLELGYILQRITPYFGLAAFLKRFVKRLGLSAVPIKYWIGQTQVVARKC